MQGDPDLMKVIHTSNSSPTFTSRLHGRKKQRYEYSNNGDHHQQFDEREPKHAATCRTPHLMHSVTMLHD
jgi:hypothetical protein